MAFTALLARHVYTPREHIEDGCVLIEDGRVAAVGQRIEVEIPGTARLRDLGTNALVPGFIDVHIHGAGGHDVMEGSREALVEIGRMLLRHGTTAYLATTVTASVEETLDSLDKLSRAIAELRMEAGGEWALPLGIHLEGPFISPIRRGVHPAEHIQRPSSELLRRILDAARGEVRMFTLASEIEGAQELIRLARSRGVLVALGHTDATYEQARSAIEAGASHAVHLYNAMRPFHHRETGIQGAVLTDPRVTAELIADGVHVDAAALRLAVTAKGIERVILVSDGTSATGMGDGRYRLGPFRVTVEQGVCRNDEGKLAGSVLTLDRALQNMIALCGLNLAQVLPMLTTNPARLAGVEGKKGAIAPGADADLVCLDSEHRVCGTIFQGRIALSNT